MASAHQTFPFSFLYLWRKPATSKRTFPQGKKKITRNVTVSLATLSGEEYQIRSSSSQINLIGFEYSSFCFWSTRARCHNSAEIMPKPAFMLQTYFNRLLALCDSRNMYCLNLPSRCGCKQEWHRWSSKEPRIDAENFNIRNKEKKERRRKYYRGFDHNSANPIILASGGIVTPDMIFWEKKGGASLWSYEVAGKGCATPTP